MDRITEHDLYNRVFKYKATCKHKDTYTVKLEVGNGFTIAKTTCYDCMKIIKTTIFSNKLGFYPFLKNGVI